jgi:hypothetical protein
VNFFLPAVKLKSIFFWAALVTGFLALLLPQAVPLFVPLALAAGWGALFLFTVLHIRNTRRQEYRCPNCGWIPFALPAWKCKSCHSVWDYFSTEGRCPRCEHQHEEAACVRCRRIARNRQWQA